MSHLLDVSLIYYCDRARRSYDASLVGGHIELKALSHRSQRRVSNYKRERGGFTAKIVGNEYREDTGEENGVGDGGGDEGRGVGGNGPRDED